MARIVLNTFGSLGDLHPYLAIAIGLRKRGHEPILATSEVYRQKILAAGVGFAPVRPDVGQLASAPESLRRLWHPRRGSEFLIRRYLVPLIEQSYEDLLHACQRADLLLTHPVGFAGPIVAKVLKLPWLSVALQPAVFFSAYDPPVISGVEWTRHLYPFGPGAFEWLMKFVRLRLDRWAAPVQKFRRQLGLEPSEGNILVNACSPFGTLALFSPSFAAPQSDWPSNTHLTGFVYYDSLGDLPGLCEDDESKVNDFLNDGPPPVLFTLGSSAILQTGEFFSESIAAVHGLRLRAVMLAGPRWTEIHNPLPDSILVADYLPFSKIMPRCIAIVHQGGIGTTAQALRSGRPMLVAPWAHDQPDNAARVVRLGFGRTIPRNRYYAPRIAKELRLLLTDASYLERAAGAASAIAQEDGVKAACDVIEDVLAGPVC